MPNVNEDFKRRSQTHLDDTLPVLGPESIGLVLTNACNLNCITCWSYSPLLTARPAKNWKTRQLSFDLIVRTLEELSALGTQRLILTGGGDPLVYPQFYETVETAKHLGLKVTLISNLTLVKDFDRFLTLGIDTIQANFSAAGTDSYVAFHPNRKPADFDKLMTHLAKVSEVSDLKLVCVICRTNVSEISEMLDIAGGLKCKIQFKLMSRAEGTEKVAISESQRQHLLKNELIIKGLALKKQVKTNLDVFFKSLKGEDVFSFPIEETGCFAGHFYSRIQADGTVRFCCNPHENLQAGNLHTQSFTEIWQGNIYQNLRKALKNRQFVSGCERCGKFDLNVRLSEKLSMTVEKSR
jgi:MoaA/NifB/PqqE/SkfB family radical SAM enzyme